MVCDMSRPPEKRNAAIEVKPKRATPASERKWLEQLRNRYNHRRFVSPDPLEVLYDYETPADREVVGLIASSLAYGNVKAMLPAIRTVLDLLGPSPTDALRTTMRRTLARRLNGFRYRFTPGSQVAALLAGMKAILEEHGSLNNCLRRHITSGEETILPALGGFVDELSDAAGSSLAHLIPHPRKGSACKRLNLYLRWMVRKDAIDPGGWRGVKPSLLIMPIDTHVYQTARWRGWTARKSANLNTALEITAVLRELCPDDPLRWDFAITRPGIHDGVKIGKPARSRTRVHGREP